MKETSGEPLSPKEKYRSSRSKKGKDSKSRVKDNSSKKQSLKSSPAAVKGNVEKKNVEHDQPSSKLSDKDFGDQTKDLLPIDYRPLTDFLDNKKELIDQLFKAIHGGDLQKIIPKSLKSFKTEEVKKMCFEELRSMPDDLIRHVLAGGTTESYVEKKVVNTAETKAADDTKSKTTLGLKRKVKGEPSKCSTFETPSKRVATEKYVSSPALSETVSSDALELCPGSKEVEILVPEENQLAPIAEENPVVPKMSKDLELLELEMRARAIRSLLLSKGKASITSSEDEDAEEEDRKHHFQ